MGLGLRFEPRELYILGTQLLISPALFDFWNSWASLEFTACPRLALNQWSSCLGLLSREIYKLMLPRLTLLFELGWLFYLNYVVVVLGSFCWDVTSFAMCFWHWAVLCFLSGHMILAMELSLTLNPWEPPPLPPAPRPTEWFLKCFPKSDRFHLNSCL